MPGGSAATSARRPAQAIAIPTMPADDREHHVLGEQLPDDSPASCTHGASHGHLGLARRGACEQQTRDVRAGNEQHETNRPLQHQERALHIVVERGAQSLQRDGHVLIAMRETARPAPGRAQSSRLAPARSSRPSRNRPVTMRNDAALESCCGENPTESQRLVSGLAKSKPSGITPMMSVSTPSSRSVLRGSADRRQTGAARSCN